MSLKTSRLVALARLPALILAILASVAIQTGCVSYKRKPIETSELLRALADRPQHSAAENPQSSPSVSAHRALTLEEAEVVALFYNPSLRTARAQAQVTVLPARHAGHWDDPVLSVDALRILEDVEKPWITAASLQFTIPVSGRLALEKKKATAAGEAALIAVWIEEQRVLAEIREAWVDWEAASKLRGRSSQLFGQMEEIVAITDRLENAGEMLAAEGAAFRLSRARIKLDHAADASREREAFQRIVALLGFLPHASPTLVSSRAVARTHDLPTTDTLLASNPAIILRKSEYEVAENALRLEVRKQFPDVSIGPAFEREDGQTKLGAGFTIPLPILNANRRAITEAHAQREAARAAWESAVQQALALSAVAQYRITEAEQRCATIRDEITPLADLQLAQARRLAEQGEVNALLLLEALNSERDAAIDAIEADALLARAEISLRALAPAAPPALSMTATNGGEHQ